jgi:large subunit ribosomal protein L21
MRSQMYAVIRAGGKQYKVAEGDVIQIEKVNGDSKTIEFEPLLVVDDKGKATSAKSDLAKAKVKAEVLGEEKGVKVKVFKYKNKSRYRRTTGHRQRYTSIRIAGISASGGRSKAKAASSEGGA